MFTHLTLSVLVDISQCTLSNVRKHLSFSLGVFINLSNFINSVFLVMKLKGLVLKIHSSKLI